MFGTGGKFRQGLLLSAAAAALCVTAVNSMAAREKWHVPDATVRFKCQLDARPTHRENGYFIDIPDGGILPKPFPQPTVIEVSAQGARMVNSYVMWQNVHHGVALIVDRPPAEEDLYVYFSPTEEVRKWTEASGLKPSPFLACLQGTSNWASNDMLSKMGSMPNNVHWRRYASWWRTAVCVPGDLTGYLGPVSVYLTFYYDAKEPGKTLFGKMPYMGSHKMRFNGQPLPMKGFSGKRGGIGGWVENVTPGLHRVEWLTKHGGGHAPFRGFMAMTCITPQTRPGKEMGGINHTGDGKPFWASRLVRFNEVSWSGVASITGAEMRNGAPVANILAKPIENFWFATSPDKPVLVYDLKAREMWYPDNARYIWQFEGGAIQQKPELLWLLGGTRHHMVSLTVEVDGKYTTCKIPIYPYAPETMVASSMNNPETPERYRQAAFDMFQAYPSDKDPTASWEHAYWNNFFRCLDLNMGQELLVHLANIRWEHLATKLEKDKLDRIRDMCIDFAPRISPQLALKWTHKFEEYAEDEREKAAMQLARAEVYMFYLEDHDRARQILIKEARRRILDPIGEQARVRLGDIAFIQGDVNEARTIYASVQKRAKHKKTQSSKGKAGKSLSKGGAANVAEWKMDALLGVAASETADSLVEQGYLGDAKKSLLNWELEFPLNKLNGDLILNNARLYISMDDYQRAKVMLEPYCEYVDTSSFLAESVKACFSCMRQLKEPEEKLVAFAEAQKGKMKFHPVARELDYYLKTVKEKNAKGVAGAGAPKASSPPKASALTKSQLLQKAMKGE